MALAGAGEAGAALEHAREPLTAAEPGAIARS